MNYSAAYLAAIAFLVFVAHAAVSRVGRHPTPLRRLSVNHALFAPVYLASSFFVGDIGWQDRLLGLYLYFALHYAFFLLAFGLSARGFSLNICVSLLRAGGPLPVSGIARDYGEGKGVGYVKSNRIEVMLESGVASRQGDALVLEKRGRRALAANRALLKLLGEDFLGRAKGERRTRR